MAAFEHGEVAQDNIVAVLERDGLVADAGLLGNVDWVVAAGGWVISKAEALAEDQPGAGDAEVVQVFTPDERVVPVLWP